jgi:enoyl-CoA hydratase/carnithine racemase
MDAFMRDELVEVLTSACDDPTLPTVLLRADGPDFSAGGDLAEFGMATDLVQAHAIRSLRSPARLIQVMAARTTAFVQGACVGAGIEIPAAAGRVIATADARFWLPELAMGLIPGAGGTVTIAGRVGRQRLLYWALSGQHIDAFTAQQWGLVDEVQVHA